MFYHASLTRLRQREFNGTCVQKLDVILDYLPYR